MAEVANEYGILTSRRSGILIETALVGGGFVAGQLSVLLPNPLARFMWGLPDSFYFVWNVSSLAPLVLAGWVMYGSGDDWEVVGLQRPKTAHLMIGFVVAILVLALQFSLHTGSNRPPQGAEWDRLVASNLYGLGVLLFIAGYLASRLSEAARSPALGSLGAAVAWMIPYLSEPRTYFLTGLPIAWLVCWLRVRGMSLWVFLIAWGVFLFGSSILRGSGG
jgi:hypothetical protein